MITTTSAGWKVDRVKGIEVYTSPAGTQYVRTANPEVAEVAIPPKSHGLPILYLVPKSAEQIVQAAERKERRIERREQARRNRKKGAK